MARQLSCHVLGIFALSGCFWLFGCARDLEPPVGAIIQCTTDKQCPGTMRCDGERGVCYDPNADEPPRVATTVPVAADRPAEVLAFEARVDDVNRNDRATLEVMFELGDGVWTPLTPLESVSALPVNRSHALSWNLTASLPTIDVETALGTRTVADYQGQVRLRARATDTGGRVGEWSESRVFEVGNRAPDLTIDGTPAVASREVVVQVTVADPAGDLGGMQMCFVLPADPDVCRAATGSDPAPTLFAAPTGTATRAVWASHAPPDADPNVAQGIGYSNDGPVELRLRTFDDATGERQAGPWQTVTWAQVINNTPPQVLSVRAPRLELVSGTAPVRIEYVLADEESDPADVSCEYSLLGAPWLPCRPVPHLRHEGNRGLHTRPIASGGVPHTFVWDPAGLAVRPLEQARVRMTAWDPALSERSSTTLALSKAPTPGEVALSLGAEVAIEGARQIERIQFDDDPEDELLLLTTAGFTVIQGGPVGGQSCTAPQWGDCGLTATEVTGTSLLGVDVADIAGDERSELLVWANDGGYLQGQIWQVVGGDYAQVLAWTTTLEQWDAGARIGDIDGDSQPDVLVWNRSAVATYRIADTGGTWSVSPMDTATSTDTGGFGAWAAVGDVNRNGRDDVVRCGCTPDYEFYCEIWYPSQSGSFGDGIIWEARFAGTPFPGNPYPSYLRDLVLVDLDDDGALELAAVDRGYDVWLTAEPIAGLGFSEWAVTFLSESPMGWTLAEVTGDAHLDFVAVARTPYAVEVYPGPGFSPGQTVGLSELGASMGRRGDAMEIVTVDGDGDGRDEIWILDADPYETGPGDRLFAVRSGRVWTRWGLPTSMEIHSAANGHAVDANSDGWPDFVYSQWAGQPQVHFGPLDRQPTPPSQVPWAADPSVGFELADVDGDGSLEWCGIDEASDQFIWHSAPDRGNFSGSVPAHGARLLTAADIDGDADLELVGLISEFSDNYGNFESLPPAQCSDGFDNDSDGYTDCDDVDCHTSCSPPEDCTDGVDNDGDYDIDCRDTDCQSLEFCVQLIALPDPGVPAYVAQAFPRARQSCLDGALADCRTTVWPVAALDVDGDGRDSVVIFEVVRGTVVSTGEESQTYRRLWAVNWDDVTMRWTPPVLIETVTGDQSGNNLIRADLDGNGIDDAVLGTCEAPYPPPWFTCDSTPPLTVLWGQPGGTVALEALDPTAGQFDDFAQNISVTDVDGDGDLDIAVAFRYIKRHAVLLGDGRGTFVLAEPIVSGEDVTGAAWIDANADGVVDILESSSNVNFGQSSRPSAVRPLSPWPAGPSPWKTAATTGERVTLSPASPMGMLATSRQRLRARKAGMTIDAPLEELTVPWKLSGDRRFITQVIDGALRTRVELVVGAAGSTVPEPLDVDSTDFSSQAAIIVELPIAYGDRLRATPTEGLRAFLLDCAYRRAADVATDPLAASTLEDDFLPLSSTGGDLIVCDPRWTELSRVAGDLEGRGPRYTLFPDDTAPTHVRLVTDRFGIFQLFVEAQ